jgi:DNA-binding response OmpR family regulator
MNAAKTVLLMDDDPDILAAMQLVFARHGYRVVTAMDGSTGIAAAEQEKPDVVVVDMMMPKKNGFQVVEQLKRGREAAPPVVMITANGGGRHRAYAEMLGVDDYLCKPFAMEKLIDSVERLCSGSASLDSSPLKEGEQGG